MRVAVVIIATALIGVLGAVPRWTALQPADRVAAVPTVPVLLYHGIASSNGAADEDGAVGLSEFTTQMAFLRDRGYHSISPAEYVAWVRGSAPVLPRNPILITFDDNEATVPLAVGVLDRYGFRPTMYVVSGFADGSYGQFYLRWPGLAALVSHGWYLQFHAGPCGHGYISANTPYHCAAGLTIAGSAKTGHRYYPQPDSQPVAAYHARVRADVARGLAAMRAHLGYPAGWRSATFAVPWDDWGQPDTSNIPWLADYFARQFAVVLVQESYPGERVARLHHMRYRFQVDASTTLAQFRTALATPRFHR